jgi:hypothetical protein
VGSLRSLVHNPSAKSNQIWTLKLVELLNTEVKNWFPDTKISFHSSQQDGKKYVSGYWECFFEKCNENLLERIEKFLKDMPLKLGNCAYEEAGSIFLLAKVNSREDASSGSILIVNRADKWDLSEL